MSIVKLPIVPLRDVVLFPGSIMPLYIGREKSIKALMAAKDGQNERIAFTAQKSQEKDEPSIEDLYPIGVIGKIIQTIRLSDTNIKLLVEGEQRVKIDYVSNEEYFEGSCEPILDEILVNRQELAFIMTEVIDLFKQYSKINRRINPEVVNMVSSQRSNAAYLSNIIACNLTCSVAKRQPLLEESNVVKRLHLLLEVLSDEVVKINTDLSISNRVRKQVEKNQKDYYLLEQIKAMQKELGEDDKSELNVLEEKIKTLPMNAEAKEKAESELKKLKSMNPMASEASVVRSYLDVIVNLPWGKLDKSSVDIKKAASILDRDHYGLDKVKERIIEYLAVLQRSKNLNNSVICFLGPPGVGKTSLAKSIAEAIGRKYTKFALGGVKDEAEIRGHRKTYLGSMPGKIIKIIKKAKTNNPVMLLDEIDKVGADYKGDPSSALLEALDPEQNKNFADHYLDFDYDISKVMFIATANSLNIPRPLLDRMEIIRIHGYIEDEKLQIAKNYLLPKQLKAHNMKDGELMVSDSAILDIIRFYTRESGVRDLERQLAAIVRKTLTRILSNKEITNVSVDVKELEGFLGVKKYRYGVAESKDNIGSTTGLVYTEVGGDLLTIEAVRIPGKGEIKATGKLGEVIKESTQTAFSFFLSQAESLGLKDCICKESDIHIHFPEGATPKDGPSAGIAIFTTIASLLTKIPVRRDVAMTGEITLRGHVLPIGGLREKLLAANRGGIKKVIIPQDNMRDLKEIPDSIKSNLEIIPVSKAIDVLDIALSKKILDNRVSL